MEPALSAATVRAVKLRRSYWTGNYRRTDVDALLARVVTELERREASDGLLIFTQLARDYQEMVAPAPGRRRKVAS